jgi:hypothetical protein
VRWSDSERKSNTGSPVQRKSDEKVKQKAFDKATRFAKRENNGIEWEPQNLSVSALGDNSSGHSEHSNPSTSVEAADADRFQNGRSTESGVWVA